MRDCANLDLRNRRVKCDETRPKCNTCGKSRRPCFWKPTKDEMKRKREILPQNTSMHSQLFQVRPTQALNFIDEREVYYFSAYQDEVALELAGPFKTSAWMVRLILILHCYCQYTSGPSGPFSRAKNNKRVITTTKTAPRRPALEEILPNYTTNSLNRLRCFEKLTRNRLCFDLLLL
jgi:hypothetical protein